MVSEKKFDSGQGGDDAEPVASRTVCTILSDAEIMQRILTENKNHCTIRRMLALGDIKERLVAQGKQILLINQAPYRDSLTECEQCTYFKGELPTWEEVQKHRK